jgi:hypothetical protein
MTLKSVIVRPMLRAAAVTYCRSAEPSSSGGVPTAMNWMVPCATERSMSVVNSSRPAAVVQDLDLGRIHVQAHHMVAHLRQACACHQSNVAGAYDGDFHRFSCLQVTE